MLAVLAWSAPAAAQVSITGAIAGTVADESDAVRARRHRHAQGRRHRHEEGNRHQRARARSRFRDLNFGIYQVTVTLQGFQTAVYNKVVVESARTTDLRIKLGVGALEQTVTVEGATPVLEMTSNVISSTLNNKAITELPLAGRNAFAFARLVPGAVAPQGTGSTHFNGMPGGTINPTIDGVNNSSNGFKSGGTSFFGTVPARLGAVEEVTVETAGLGGDAGVTGGVNLKFVTRRGTNQYRGSVFEQYRTDKLNANSFGNSRPRPAEGRSCAATTSAATSAVRSCRAARSRNKLFFFANYEQEYIPQTQTRTQTVLTAEAQQGIFRYQTAAGEQRTVNVLDIAGAERVPVDAGPDDRRRCSRSRRRRAPVRHGRAGATTCAPRS